MFKKQDVFESKPKMEGDRRTYYPNRPLAQTAADRGQREYMEQGVYSATASFEPGHGFVATLFSTVNIPDANDAGFEVKVPSEHVDKTPADWAAPKKAAPKTTTKTGGTATAPTSGATARVHAIAGALKESGQISSRADRAKVIAACQEAGINPATAGTQWAAFAKIQGW